jgi:hypothetical protein
MGNAGRLFGLGSPGGLAFLLRTAGLLVAVVVAGFLFGGGFFDDGILGDDLEGQLEGDVGVQLDVGDVLAEELDGTLAEVDALTLDHDTLLGEASDDFGDADGAEHLATLAGLNGEGEGDALDFGGELGRGLEIAGLTDFPGLGEGVEILLVGAVDGKRDALEEQVVARVAGLDADLVAFGA